MRLSDFRRSFVLTLVAGLAAIAPSAIAQEAGAAKAGLIVIEGAPRETESPLGWLFGDGEEHTLSRILKAIDGASRDPEVRSLVVRLKDAELTATTVEELAAAFKQFRATGKKIRVFAEAFDGPGLLLASHADEAIVQSGGAVALPGLHMEEMFLADAMGWLGLKSEMVQIGDYKGASEMMSRSAPSPQWDQNINALLDGMYANMRGTLKAGRKLDDAKLENAMKQAWMADGATAVKAGLLDAEVDLPALLEHIRKAEGASVEWSDDLLADEDTKLDTSNPLAMIAALSQEPDRTPDGDTIAVLHIQGTIIDGDSTAGGMFGGEGSVGSRTIRNAIEDILDQDEIKGVILRIDSPGGSAVASEVMWQGIARLAATRPVWVSVGGMAASGGYYVASAGSRVYVNPSSIVGSIGVVGGKVNMAGLYEKLKVNVVSRSRGPMAGMFRTTGSWSPEELAAVRSKMTETYDLFTRRVVAGRKGIDLKQTAEGRLFTGNQAITNKMADKIGGLDSAVRDLAAELKLDDYSVMEFPGPKSLGDVLKDSLGGFVAAPAGIHAASVRPTVTPEIAAAIRLTVGPKALPKFEQAIAGFEALRSEHVILMSPSLMLFR
jgi:protease-4